MSGEREQTGEVAVICPDSGAVLYAVRAPQIARVIAWVCDMGCAVCGCDDEDCECWPTCWCALSPGYGHLWTPDCPETPTAKPKVAS